MIVGFVLGFMTFISGGILWGKLPPGVQKFLREHHLITDLLAFLFTFFTITAITKSVAGVIAAAAAGLGVDIALKSLDYLDENPEVKEKLEHEYEVRTEKVKNRFRDLVMAL